MNWNFYNNRIRTCVDDCGESRNQRRRDNGYFDEHDENFSEHEHDGFSYKDGPFVIDNKEERKPNKPKIFIRGVKGGRRQLFKKTFLKGVMVDVEDTIS